MKAEQLVKQVLTESVLARSDDKELLLKVWEKQGFVLSYYQRAAFKRLFSAETCRRYRQKYQESGLFPADENTKRGRKAKEAKMRVEMKKKVYTPVLVDGKVDHYIIT